MRTSNHGRFAFTLVEMLVVVAIIGILAAMLLPAVARAKRQGYVTTCLNNMHQIGLALQMYLTDQQKYANSLGGEEVPAEFACGLSPEQRLAEMRARCLYNYISYSSKVWWCPEDKGLDFRKEGPFFGPTAYYAFGVSYRLNTGPWLNTKYLVDGVLPGQKEGWVRQPSQYIYLYEPPAQPMIKPVLNPDFCHMYPITKPYSYFHWHLNTGPSSLFDIATDQQKAWSPILFIDGHAALHDFSQSLRADWEYPTEAMKDWTWYQPVLGTNGQPVQNPKPPP